MLLATYRFSENFVGAILSPRESRPKGRSYSRSIFNLMDTLWLCGMLESAPTPLSILNGSSRQ